MLPSRVHIWNGNVHICQRLPVSNYKMGESAWGQHHKTHEALRINLTLVEI